jgi:hypothetical protein
MFSAAGGAASAVVIWGVVKRMKTKKKPRKLAVRDSFAHRAENSKTEPKRDLELSADPHRPGRSRFHFLSSMPLLSFLAIVACVVVYLLLGYPDLTRLPSHLKIILGTVAFTSVAIRWFFFGYLYGDRDPRSSRKFWLAISLSDFIFATAFAAALLYYFGAVRFVAVALQKGWPYLSDRGSYVLSSILSWVMSGIVGNYAFHLIRVRFGKK